MAIYKINNVTRKEGEVIYEHFRNWLVLGTKTIFYNAPGIQDIQTTIKINGLTDKQMTDLKMDRRTDRQT